MFFKSVRQIFTLDTSFGRQAGRYVFYVFYVSSMFAYEPGMQLLGRIPHERLFSHVGIHNTHAARVPKIFSKLRKQLSEFVMCMLSSHDPTTENFLHFALIEIKKHESLRRCPICPLVCHCTRRGKGESRTEYCIFSLADLSTHLPRLITFHHQDPS